jgi:NAD(P)-dependent dehydrogenase (short-subunit alcohol dehydrogenase family)
MSKTILLTGATDGIGLETAKNLASGGHVLLMHGRNPQKMEAAVREVASLGRGARIEAYTADLSKLSDTAKLAAMVRKQNGHIDVLINNAGVLKAPNVITDDGLDVRFAVNTLAPYLLTKELLPIMDAAGRVVNVSSAAQSPVDIEALTGGVRLDDMEAYGQSKLALNMWTRTMAASRNGGPLIVAVNPGSLLASKMVKEGFGVAGSDLGIGADILTRAALSDEFADANGKYYDNDAHRFAPPQADALDEGKSRAVVQAIESILAAHAAYAG